MYKNPDNNISEKGMRITDFSYLFSAHAPLEKIEPFAIGKGEDNSFVAAFRRILACTGCDIPYWKLMAWSGAAFRLQIHRNSWRMNSIDLITGYDLSDSLAKICGVTFERYWVCGNKEKIEIAKQKACKSLEKGIPVIGLGTDGKAFHSLVLGITSRDKLMAITASIPATPHAVSEKSVWCYHYMHGTPCAPEEKHVVYKAICTACDLLKTTRSGTFHIGLNAYEYWQSTLVNPMHHDPYDNDWRAHERNDGNYWLLITLYDARKCAARFFHYAACLFPHISDDFHTIGNLYDSIVEEIEPLLEKKRVRPDKEISRARPWTQRDRRIQAGILGKARKYEEKLIPLLKQLQEKTDEPE